MRICYLTDFFVPHYQGGGERRYYEIAKRLVKKGHSVDIICMRIHNVCDEEKIDGINVHHIGPTINSPPKRKLSDFFKFLHAQKHWLKKHNYDIIEAQGASIFILPWAKLFLKKPSIALIHDISSGEKDQWFAFGNISALYEKTITKLPFTKILTVGSGTKNQLIKQHGVKTEQIKVIHNGADLKTIDSVKVKTIQKNTIIFAGRLVPHKHVDDLLKAMQIINKKMRKAKLKIIGTGPQEGTLKKLAKELKLENTQFLGQIKEYEGVIKEIKKSTLLVLPSTREGFGIVLAEANACKKPVIAYDIDGVRDVVQSTKNGLLVPPNNVEELANAILHLLANNKLCLQMGLEGRKRVEEKFTWDKTASEIENFYNSLIYAA